MHRIENVYFNETYYFVCKRFPNYAAFTGINVKNYDFHGILTGYTMKIKFAGILTMINIFVTRSSKYVNICNFTKIRAKRSSKPYQLLFSDSNRILNNLKIIHRY